MQRDHARSAYFIGIQGVGMTALAQLLVERGWVVTGSDTRNRYFTADILERAGISYSRGFDSSSVPKAVDLVVHSTAYGRDHEEVAVAIERGLLVQTYPEAVAEIFNSGKGIAVCGTHGKTTTTAMLGLVLVEAGVDPTVVVGSDVPQLGGAARGGSGDLVLLEADEYQDKLQCLKPFGVILTNVEYDHPDWFANEVVYRETFERFISRIPADGWLVVCEDDPGAMAVSRQAKCPVIPYGLERLGSPRFTLTLPGVHNLQNALGAIAAATELGVDRAAAVRTLELFEGTRRRFELVGNAAGVVVIDDYGHHPTEIRATVAATLERYPGRRLLVAFHAHTFTRTIALKDDFAAAFLGTAHVFVMDIFGSAREVHGGINAQELARSIAEHNPASASGDTDATIKTLANAVRPGDVVLCIGAGENDVVARGLVGTLQEKSDSYR